MASTAGVNTGNTPPNAHTSTAIHTMNTDVAIIGGGPGGSTLATLLARRGHDVTLFEKAQHPRFHVGESLLPMNLPIFERLGVLEQINQIGVPKLGADFTFGDRDDLCQVYRFERALGDCPPYAFEVRRDRFDQILFEASRAAGTHIWENTRVTAVSPDRDRATLQAETSDGMQVDCICKIVIDASGRDAFMAAKNGWRRPNKQHASAAIFGHFKNVTRREGRDQGNISIYHFDHGWIWMIPLHDNTVSVGATCWPEYLKTRRGDTETFLRQTLALSKPAQVRMRDARAISPVRVAANYSYASKKLWNNYYMAIGDACAFLDPVFSSGVYLAMHNAEQAVSAIEYKLQGKQRHYRSACRRYVKANKRGLKAFSWFIYRFTTPAMQTLFTYPRNIWQVENAVISLLAGDVFNNIAVARRLWLFKLLYAVSWLINLKQSLIHRRRRLRSLQSQFRDINEV